MGIRVAGAPNIRITSTHTVGTTAGKVLDANKKRLEYRVRSATGNGDLLYHGYDSHVSTSSEDIIAIGGLLEDSGDPSTVYCGEVWLVSGTAGQTAYVEEVVKV